MCEGVDKDKPVEGMLIIRGMKMEDGILKDGKILDPESGKFYYAKISLRENKLVLRGSIDNVGLLGRSQTWNPGTAPK